MANSNRKYHLVSLESEDTGMNEPLPSSAMADTNLPEGLQVSQDPGEEETTVVARIEKRWPCELCGKLLTRASGVTQHWVTHLNNPPTDAAGLACLARAPQGARRFYCSRCPRYFARKDKFEIHMNDHNMSDQCSKKGKKTRLTPMSTRGATSTPTMPDPSDAERALRNAMKDAIGEVDETVLQAAQILYSMQFLKPSEIKMIVYCWNFITYLNTGSSQITTGTLYPIASAPPMIEDPEKICSEDPEDWETMSLD